MLEHVHALPDAGRGRRRVGSRGERNTTTTAAATAAAAAAGARAIEVKRVPSDDSIQLTGPCAGPLGGTDEAAVAGLLVVRDAVSSRFRNIAPEDTLKIEGAQGAGLEKGCVLKLVNIVRVAVPVQCLGEQRGRNGSSSSSSTAEGAGG